MQCEVLVKEFVAEGLLEPPTESRAGYAFTRRVCRARRRARGRAAPPHRAKQLIAEARAFAERFNDEAVHNPMEVVGIAVYGET